MSKNPDKGNIEFPNTDGTFGETSAPPIQGDRSGNVRDSNTAVPGIPNDDLFHLVFKRRTIYEYILLMKTWLFSALLHLIVLLFFLFCWVGAKSEVATIEIISMPGEGENLSNDAFFDDSLPTESEVNVGLDAVTAEPIQDSLAEVPTVLNADPVEKSLPLETMNPALNDFSEFGALLAGRTTDPIKGRGANKQMLLAAGGGSSGSEKAVSRSLYWLAEHQFRDGHWSFQHSASERCQGKCRHPGSQISSVLGATSLALLPFLSSGNTPFKGKYKKQVRLGISWLLEHAKFEQEAVSFFEQGGTMYSHGIAALVLNETYAMMSETERRKWPAVGAAAYMSGLFIGVAQDPTTGGWRYGVRMPGDTSVSGWQVMALKSMIVNQADLARQKKVLGQALHFFRDVTAYDNGSRYGYLNASNGSLAMTAVGLLCRLYLDWKPSTPELLKGADFLLSMGPDIDNPYYTYYGTLLFHNIGGARWTKWNLAVRDELIKSQVQDGHEAGSWYPDDDRNGFCTSGGRLYVTALNCMTLQIYYRYLPIYKSLGDETKFPVE